MYQLFFPHVGTATAAILSNVGLADFAEGANFLGGEGPDGRCGIVVGWPRLGQPRLGFQPDRQRWIPALCGEYSIGFWNDETLTPEALVRPITQDGPLVEIEGGRWMVPSLTALPQVILTRPDGSIELQPVKRWDAYGRACLNWKSRILKRGLQQAEAQQRHPAGVPPEVSAAWEPLPYAGLKEFVLQALRINYRLLPEVADELQLITTANVLDLAIAACGLQEPPQ